jgi:hypothetical protein
MSINMENETPVRLLGPLMGLVKKLRGEVMELQGQLDAKRRDLMLAEATLERLHVQLFGEATSNGNEALGRDVQQQQASLCHQYLEILL